MNTFLISVGSIIIVLGVLILVHEWGHFIVARMCGVRVDVFSVGMGPRIWGFRRGQTDYRVSALPIGGYVKMAGENPTDERTGAPDEFLSKSRWRRALIIMAGPTMNLALALVIAMGIMMTGPGQQTYLKKKPVVWDVVQGTPAAKAGIHTGDVLTKINGKPVRTWDDVLWKTMFTVPGSTLHVVVMRNSHPVALQVHSSSDYGLSGLFGFPVEKTYIAKVEKGQPASKAGLEAGDQIVSVNGKQDVSPTQLVKITQDSDGKPLSMTLKRNGRLVNLVLHPAYGVLPGAPKDETGKKIWHIGASTEARPTYAPNTVGSAVEGAVRYNVMYSSAILKMVGTLIEHKTKLKQLSGPVGIAKVSGQAAREGLLPFMNLIAIVSLNLGILNLLPIPILDGWHLLTLGVEGTIRRDLSLAVKERAMQVGLVFLLLLFLIVTYNDVLKLITPTH